jgi:hypothetical protein
MAWLKLENGKLSDVTPGRYQPPADSPWSDDTDDRILETLGMTDHEMAGNRALEAHLAFVARTLIVNRIDLTDAAAIADCWQTLQMGLKELAAKGILAVPLPSEWPARFLDAAVLAAGDAEFIAACSGRM